MKSLERNEGYEWTSEGVCSATKIEWGITEQANGVVAILVNAPGGVLTGKQLRILSEIVGDEGIIKNSRRMAPVLLVPRENVGGALEKLKQAELRVANLHSSVRNIVACPGKGLSMNSRGDTLELAAALDREFYGTVLPWDFKIGISGCPRNCSGVHCHDVGLMAEPRGKYSLWIGGTESGTSPKHGELIRKGIPRHQVPAVIRRIMEEYSELGEKFNDELGKRIRLYRVIEKVGLEHFNSAVEETLASFSQ
jgi:dissimilatory sulfite reductase (desulfoviridin) alpha/beta subunit